MPPSWDEIGHLVRLIVTSRGVPACERDDLIQEIRIACWQEMDRPDVKNWHGYFSGIAHHKVLDWMERRRAERKLLELWKAEGGLSGFHRSGPGLELERAVYFILEYLRAHRAICADIAERRYFGGLSWSEVAEQFQQRVEAVRQQWHRCRVFLLERVRAELVRILETRLDDPEVRE